MKEKQTIPVFYAIDDNYIPFLHVSLLSLKDNRDENKNYIIHILHSGIKKEHETQINELACDGFRVEFVDVADKIDALSSELNLRDYYTFTTYYRIFIAGMFPEYDKAVYLDSDTIVRADVADLFDTQLGDNLIAGIPDGAVSVIPPFQVYTDKVLGIKADKYFNAGIIVMNLKLFREENFYDAFNDLLGKYKFRVAQDQDYLNVLCRNRVVYLPEVWNVMPVRSVSTEKVANPKIIHYNLTSKPWHYKGLMYEEYFWEYADKSCFAGVIRKELENFSDADKKKDDDCEKGLVALTVQEANDPNNYFNRFCK